MERVATHEKCNEPECWWCQPILCDGYREPDKHWEERREGGIIRLGRRRANVRLVDGLRDEIRLWRRSGYPSASPTTRRLLEHWTAPAGTGSTFPLFFAQQEAVETLIYLSEAAIPGSSKPLRELQTLAKEFNGGMLRAGCQMATGTGKTMVMACMIAWYAATRRSRVRHQPGRLAQNVEDVLVIAPSLTVARRLRGLIPSQQDNIYDKWNLLPDDLRGSLASMKVTVVNWHKFLPKGDIDFEGVGSNAPKRDERRLAGYEDDVEESPDQIFDRVLKRHARSGGQRLVIMNDEAHHCYNKRSGYASGKPIQQNRWMEAVLNLKGWDKLPAAQCIDLTATPHFINPKQSEAPESIALSEGDGMPWIVSRFDLEDAMESGLVKIPQHPTWDDSGATAEYFGDLEETVLRNLYERNGGKDLDSPEGFSLVRRGLDLLVKDWSRTREEWADAGTNQEPVLIVVANTKANAAQIYDYIAGTVQFKRGSGRSKEVWGRIPGSHGDLANVPRHNCPSSECFKRTMLVYSSSRGEKGEGEELSGGALGVERFDTRNRERMMDILATVGQPGKPGESVRCVVSVSMLTEGWDCQTVTHILGYRKFGTRLLTEQVLGRALRRADYENRESVGGRFNPEFATLFGVPMPSTRSGGGSGGGGGGSTLHTVKSIDERAPAYRVHFPRFKAYDAVDPGDSVFLDPTKVGPFQRLSNITYEELPRTVEVGGTTTISVEVGRDSGIWDLAGELTEKLIERGKGLDREQHQRRAKLFSDVLRAVRQWLRMPGVEIEAEDLTNRSQREHASSHLLSTGCLKGIQNQAKIVGVPCDEDIPIGHTGGIEFQTRLRDTVDVCRSELNKAACHSKLEVEIANVLDKHPGVEAFARNYGPLGWEIPYRWQGGWSRYVPDFIARGRATSDGTRCNLIVEGKGIADERSKRKATWTRDWWVPAAEERSEDELSGTWRYLEIGDDARHRGQIADIITAALNGGHYHG